MEHAARGIPFLRAVVFKNGASVCVCTHVCSIYSEYIVYMYENVIRKTIVLHN